MWNVLLAQVAVATSTASAAPPPPTAPPPAAAEKPWPQQLAQRVDVYGRFDGHLAVTGHGLNIENNGSRLGVKAEQDVAGGFAVLGQGEWRISVGKGDTSYNLSENPDTGLGRFEASQSAALTTRLGFVGLRHQDYGTLTLGKQWGVYYDVSAWTDQYVVFGTRGSSTFNAGTDGGQTGEGRANDALICRIEHGPLKLGLQGQFGTARSSKLDGLGASLVLALGKSLRVGVAYSHAFLDFASSLVGYDGDDAQAFTAGMTFEAAGWKLAALDTWTHDHELVTTDTATVVYDTLGAELFLSRRIREQFLLYGGFDFAIPRHVHTDLVDANFGTRDVIGGGRWLLDEKAGSFVYLEGRTGQTRSASGAPADDVVMLGVRFNYSLRRALGF